MAGRGYGRRSLSSPSFSLDVALPVVVSKNSFLLVSFAHLVCVLNRKVLSFFFVCFRFSLCVVCQRCARAKKGKAKNVAFFSASPCCSTLDRYAKEYMCVCVCCIVFLRSSWIYYANSAFSSLLFLLAGFGVYARLLSLSYLVVSYCFWLFRRHYFVVYIKAQIPYYLNFLSLFPCHFVSFILPSSALRTVYACIIFLIVSSTSTLILYILFVSLHLMIVQSIFAVSPTCYHECVE